MKEMRRVLALVLCLVMLIGIVPAAAFATESEAPAEESGYTDLGTKTAAEGNEQENPLPEEIQQLVGAPADAPALAADGETPIDAAIIFSDLHTRSNDAISNKLGNVSGHRYTTAGGHLTSILGAMKDLPVSSVTSAGDAFAVNEDTANDPNAKFYGYTSVLNGYINSVFPGVPVNYVWADHDRYAKEADNTTALSKESGFVYGAGEDGTYGTSDDGNYYIFELSMADTSSDDRYGAGMHSDSEVAAAISEFTATANQLDTTKPLFIVAHQPLLYRRQDNDRAYQWWEAIDPVAKKMDVAYFFGHNHAKDVVETNKSDYYYAKGAQMDVAKPTKSKQTVTLSFPHMCVGYMNPTSTNNVTRKNVAVAAVIYEDKIEYNTYSATGVYSANWALDAEQKRDFVVESIAASATKTEYAYGETFDESTVTVTATYGNDTTAAVTGYTLSGYDMNVAGEQTVTVTYKGKTATFTITVAAPVVEEPEEPEMVTVSAEATYVDINGEHQPNGDTIAATGIGLTSITAVWNDVDVSSVLDTYAYAAYDVALEGYTEGDVTVTLNVGYVDAESEVKLYFINEDGSLEEVEDFEAVPYEPEAELVEDAEEDEEYGYTAAIVTFTVSAPSFTVAVGNPSEEAPAEAVLERLELTPPEKVTYFDTDAEYNEEVGGYVISLDIDGMEVTAVYSLNGEEITETLEWNRFGTEEGYALTFEGLAPRAYGKKTVTVSYGGMSAEFNVWLCAKDMAVSGKENITASFEFPGVTGLTALKVTDKAELEIVAKALEDLVTNMTVYNFIPEYAVGDALSGTASITLPIPEGVTNPVVYYVSDNGGEIERMPTTVNGDGTLTFVTTHFSDFTVGEDETLTVGDPTVATGTENISVDTTKTAYVLVDTPTAGNQYILVSRNTAGDGYALKENTTAGVSIRVNAAGNGASAPYIETTDATIMWNTATGMTFRSENGRYYLRNNDGLTFSTNYSTNWKVDNGKAYASSFLSSYRYYLNNNNGTWRVNASNGNSNSYRVYFYEAQPVDSEKMETVTGTYSIAGNPGDVQVAAIAGNTVALNTVLRFKVDNVEKKKWDNHANVVFSEVENGDPKDVITIKDNAITLTGNTGIALVKVSCTPDGATGVATNYIRIIAREPVYQIDIEPGIKIETSFVTAGTKQQLEAALFSNYADVLPPANGENGTRVYQWKVVSGSDVITLEGGADGTLLNGDTVNAVYTGKDGVATVQVSYTWIDAANNEQTLTDTIVFENKGPRYEIKTYYRDQEVNTVPVKGVNENTTCEVSADVIQYTATSQSGTKVDGAILTWKVLEDASGILDKDAGITLGDSTGKEVSGTGPVKLNFSGKGGMATIQITYTDGTTVNLTVTAAQSNYFVPEDGTNDFPDYPNQGSVVIDKTATPVGDFNKTGIAQVELSMFGVPVTKGVDVVVVIDTSSSMKKDANGDDTSGYNDPDSRYAIMKDSLEDMLKTFQGANVDIAIVDFNGYGQNAISGATLSGSARTGTNYGKVYTGVTNATRITESTMAGGLGGVSGLGANHFEKIAAGDTGTARITKIVGGFTGGQSGTNYDFGFEAAYELLKDKKAANEANGDIREQYVIFMTDGAPFRYNGFTTDNNAGRTLMDNLLDGNYADAAALDDAFNTMDATVAAMYNPQPDPDPNAVEDGANDIPNRVHLHRMAEAIKGDPNQTYQVVDSTNSTPYLKDRQGLGAKIYSIGFCIANDDYNDRDGGIVRYQTSEEVVRILSSGEGYYWKNVKTSDGLTGAFNQIAGQIKAAASDVAVNDLVGENYNLIFEIPDNIIKYDNAGNVVEDPTNGQEFYLEVVNYALDNNYKRTGVSDSLLRVYLEGNAFKAYTVKHSADGKEEKTAVATAFAAIEEGETGYFNASGKYLPEGGGTHKITAGVYSENDAAGNLKYLVTPYFTYDAVNEDLDWTTNELGNTKQIALRYFVYLEGSAGSVAGDDALEPGVYKTNEKATVTYTNHLGNLCQQTFPIPQMTWSGAQVGVSFYLVNDLGQPINRSGQVVPLSAATFVTGTFYESVVWNTEKMDPLKANILAQEHLPEEYELYDANASYTIHVYNKETGETVHDFFIIDGTANPTAYTTYVYNNINGTTYNQYGAYSSTAGVTETVTYEEKQADGTYVEKSVQIRFNTGSEIDYASTNVAFAVRWIPTMAEDTIVVDYGLPVAINVVQNDQLENTVNSIGNVVIDRQAVMNTGVVATSPIGVGEGARMENNMLILPDGNRVVNYNGTLYFVQNDMEFSDSSVFYYDSKVSYVKNGQQNGYMYSKVTVIPATTVYYEDSFLKLEAFKDNQPIAVDSPEFWTTEGQTKTNATQSADRPGDDRFHLPGYDADNPYGYDPVYDNCSEYSLGSARKINVKSGKYGTATFSFYGTGFDIISLTSNTTGTIVIRVYPEGNGEDGFSTEQIVSYVVDTYYGYEYGPFKVTYTYQNGTWTETEVVKISAEEMAEDEKIPEEPENGATYTVYQDWRVTDPNSPNALYQVPVMKVSGLGYGRYKAVITASYSPMFDHTEDPAGYDFYLDAIRIYDPCGKNDETANGAYGADGEFAPKYEELRNQIIETGTFAGFFTEATIENGVFTENVTYYTKDAADRFTVIAADEEYNSKTTYYTMIPGVSVEGAVYITSTFIDGKGTVANTNDYQNYGPNNEVYLAKGQAVATKLTVTGTAPAGNYEPRVYLGIKSVGGEDKASVEVYGIDANGKETPAVKEVLSTATDMYYDITNLIGKVVVIRNSGSEGIVSITNVKTAYEEGETKTRSGNEGGLTPNSVNAAAETEESMFTVDSETLKLALLSLCEPIKVEQPNAPEGGEPGGNEPGGEPEGGEPGGNEPGGEPEGGEPGGNEPGGEPEGGEPGGNEPGGEPEGGEPGGNEPGGEPEGGEPGGNVPQDPAPSEPVPEETEPEEKESVEETIQDIVEIIRDIIGIIGGMFRGWF